jgi:hypothetical protein|tara:strand:- start:2176 stop:2934 length:759 start_codon:yes stop_codon:yes gene_type:complete
MSTQIRREFKGRQRKIIDGYIGVSEFSITTTMPVGFIYKALERGLIKGYKKCVKHCQFGIGEHEGDGKIWYIPLTEIEKLKNGGYAGVIAKGFDWQFNPDVLRKNPLLNGLPFEPLPLQSVNSNGLAEPAGASGVSDGTSGEAAPTIERPSPPPPERPSPPPTTPRGVIRKLFNKRQKQETTLGSDTFTSPVDAQEHLYKFGFFEGEAYCAVYTGGSARANDKSIIGIPLSALEKILCAGWAYDAEIKGRTS